jgi:hypothetical protein
MANMMMKNRQPGGPGAPNAPNAGNMANMMNRMRPGGPGGPPGAAGAGAGGAGGAGAANVDTSPADFSSPEGAVKAFLSALKAKDLDRLNEATALRAQRDASAKNRDLFKKIFDLTLSDSDLDDLARKLDGYNISGENPPTSTGRLDIIVSKSIDGGGYLTRKVTVRHEKKGWGVLDIAAPHEFKPTGRIPQKKKR